MRQATGGHAGTSVPAFDSVAEVSPMLGMSTMTVYRAIADDEFPAIKIRGRLIVPAKALEAMVDAATASQAPVDAADYVTPSAA